MGESIIKSISSSVASEGKILPRYLGASTSSCHDFCKYGTVQAFESQGEYPTSDSFSKSGSISKRGDRMEIPVGKNRKHKPHAKSLISSSQSKHRSSTKSMSGSIRKDMMQINLADDLGDACEVINVDEKHITVPISGGIENYEAKESGSASPFGSPEQVNEIMRPHKQKSKKHPSSKPPWEITPKATLFSGKEALTISSMSNASGDSCCTADEDTSFKDLRVLEIKEKNADLSTEEELRSKPSEEERANIHGRSKPLQKNEASPNLDKKHHIMAVSEVAENNGSKRSGQPLSSPQQRNGSLRQQKQRTRKHVTSKPTEEVESNPKAKLVLQQEVLTKSSMSNASVDSCCTTDEYTAFKDIGILEMKEVKVKGEKADLSAEKELLAKSPQTQRTCIHANSKPPHNIESDADVDEKHITVAGSEVVHKNGARISGSTSPFNSPEKRNGSLRQQKQRTEKRVASKLAPQVESSPKVAVVAKKDVMAKSSLSNASVDSCITIEDTCKDIWISKVEEDNGDLSTEKELSVRSTQKKRIDIDETSKPQQQIESSPKALVSTDELLANSLEDSSGGSDGDATFKNTVLSEKKEVRKTDPSTKPFSSFFKSHGPAISKPIKSKAKMLSASSPSVKVKLTSKSVSTPNSKPLVTKAQTSSLSGKLKHIANGSKKPKDTMQITEKSENAPSAATNTQLGSRNRNPKSSTNSLPSSLLLNGVGLKSTKFKEDLVSANKRRASISLPVDGTFTKSGHKTIDVRHHYRIQNKLSQASPSSSSPSSLKENRRSQLSHMYEHPKSGNVNKTVQCKEKQSPRSAAIHPQVKEDSPHKLIFRRGRVISVPAESSSPTRLRFRQGTVLQTHDSERVIWRSSTRRRSLGTNYVNNSSCIAPAVRLRHQDIQAKKKIQDYNQVIEETADKLVKSRKSKVKALVGAFETVISLQDAKLVVAR